MVILASVKLRPFSTDVCGICYPFRSWSSNLGKPWAAVASY